MATRMPGEAEKLVSPDPGPYGTFAEDKQEHCHFKQDVQFEWESRGNAWGLLLAAGITVGKILAALGVLYWTLLRDNKNLMRCDPSNLTTAQVIGCEYTKAFLRAFPLLGISVTLAIALRMMVQQRLYYGLLKAGGLLDFKNIAGYQDPLFLVMLVSLLHSVAHFVLKLSDGHGDLLQEVQDTATQFIVPYCIFMAFFYASTDIEQMLVPLSKYYEEDPEYARLALAHITFMEEDVLRKEIEDGDVVGAALSDKPAIEDTYRELIRGYGAAKERHSEDAAEGFLEGCQIRKSMWPGVVLIDSRLGDDRSKEFRAVFWTFLVLCVPIQLCVFFLFAEQALYEDLYKDVYLGGQTWDTVSAGVIIAHAGCVLWILHASWWLVLSSEVHATASALNQEVKATAAAIAEAAAAIESKAAEAGAAIGSKAAAAGAGTAAAIGAIEKQTVASAQAAASLVKRPLTSLRQAAPPAASVEDGRLPDAQDAPPAASA